MTEFTIGADAWCSDGPCGKLTRLIVNPETQAVTHLVIEPEHRGGRGRIVPVGLVDDAAGAIKIRCTKAEFDELDPGEETDLLPGDGGRSLAEGPRGSSARFPVLVMASLRPNDRAGVATHDSIPRGEVDVRRGEPVYATDGEIGKIQGLVIEPGSRHVTHVLLEEGHLWGRKEVAIPVSSITRVGDIIRLTIDKHQVQSLPPVDIDRLPT
ncbi:MAG TPA: PRC-barrel domain-containing protein [Streptosporangiaceae bacterium]|nr:PRC-barrel domain-containing protein [Streptosporangiaceae bacterium]